MTSLQTTDQPKGTYSLISLGCPKNLVDSEWMAGLLEQEGYQFLSDLEGADLVIINTCGFIDLAREESLDVIHQMIELKEQGKVRGVIVAGCMAQRNGEALLEECPGIDQVVGVFAREDIAEAADRILRPMADRSMETPPQTRTRTSDENQQRTLFRPAPVQQPGDEHRVRMTFSHLAYLKIAEGCDRKCTFCSIPSIRGKHRSKTIEQLVKEAEELAADGVRELILIAQDTSYYGLDLYGKPCLAQLLRALDAVDGIAWIRLMYLYPMHLSDELLEVIAGHSKILPYLDIPLQHINDEVLQRMKRRVTRHDQEVLLERIRQRVENIVLRTTLMTGFPGETETQFQELVRFVQQWQFERLGVFAYRPEPGTPSAQLENQLPEAVKQARREELLAVQQEIAFSWSQSQSGRKLDVLIDCDIPGEKNAYIGRSYADAPEIDPVVYVTGNRLMPGKIVSCEIVTSNEYDLIGVSVGKPR